MPCGPRLLCPLAGCNSTAKNGTNLARSRMEIEIFVFDFGKRRRIFFIVRLNLVQQRRKLRPRSGIAYNSIPCHVAVQFGQKTRQIFDQFLTLNRRKCANRNFDFIGGTHQKKIAQEGGRGNTRAICFAPPFRGWLMKGNLPRVLPLLHTLVEVRRGEKVFHHAIRPAAPSFAQYQFSLVAPRRIAHPQHRCRSESYRMCWPSRMPRWK